MFHAYLVDVTERKHAERTLAYLAYHDPLTGLPNRRRLEHDLEEALEREEGFGAVMLLNVDRLRRVVDSLGLQVLAEGVEHPAQLEALARFGCDAYQGFLAAPALLWEEFTARFTALARTAAHGGRCAPLRATRPENLFGHQ